MDPAWRSEFGARMRRFESARRKGVQGVPISLKVRITSGCFHREHSPEAYKLIDNQLASRVLARSEFEFIEHESGPELLVFAALATAGVTLAKSVIDLVTAIVKARSVGIERGDRPSDPLEVIVRRVGDGGKFAEETVVRVAYTDLVTLEELQARIEAGVRRVLEDDKAKSPNHAMRKCPAKRQVPRRKRR